MSRFAKLAHGISFFILLLMALWGWRLYPTLPDMIPTHWGPSGVPDAFSQKSIWSAFGPLMIAFVLIATIFFVHLLMNRGKDRTPTEIKAMDIVMAYLNLSLVFIFSWVMYAGWLGAQLGVGFMIFSMMAGLPVLIIIGWFYPKMAKERKAMTTHGDPSQDPRFWIWGGFFYNNPNDSRTWVPKPPHTGFGKTMNLATTGGKLMVLLILLLLVGSIIPIFFM